ncbi:MAG: DNA polymerase ligase N-terminal domain-containing protein, partial [Actinomycetota bacterium]
MTDELGEYRRKRNPKATPEPFGASGERPAGPVFVVQRHDARRLHYDFRLELDGALASWAVPKGVPLEPGQRVLAVHVEDHPLDYASFEGTIPAGNYGAGTVELWDTGTFELVERKPDGGLTVHLHGGRLEGLWTLIPAHLDGQEKNWLLVKKHDEADRPVRNDYRPMLATLADGLPRGDDWTYEVKWDGYRALGYVRNGTAKLVSRNGNDLTPRFTAIARALEKATRRSECVVDGEVCALDEQGRPSFSAMQQGRQQLVYAVFDVLEIDGVPVVDLPIEERRERLEQLLNTRTKGAEAVQVSVAFDDGEALFEAAQQQGLEGVMAKKRGSRYTE